MKIFWDTIKKHYTKPKKDEFPIGLCCYIAWQGEGKTLSAVAEIYRVIKKFPKCIVVSNTPLKLSDYILADTTEKMKQAFRLKNGQNGVIYLIDEAHNFMFGKKKGVSIESMNQLCQQRKQRKRIIMTTQIWEDLDVPVRKQVPKVVKCRKIGKWQINTIYKGKTLHYDKKEGEWVADKDYTEIYKHNDEYYNRYDTLAVITDNEEMTPLTREQLINNIEILNKKR